MTLMVRANITSVAPMTVMKISRTPKMTIGYISPLCPHSLPFTPYLTDRIFSVLLSNRSE